MCKNIVIPKAQYDETSPLQLLSAALVRLVSQTAVLTTIELDRKRSLNTEKVHDVTPAGHLPRELETHHSPVA
jgi:hypothetical protein